jgi:integrase
MSDGYDVIALPASPTKDKQTHLIPLSAPAQAILVGRASLPGDFVFGGVKAFPSWSHGRSLLDAALAEASAKLKPWTLHDIRRSVATGMAELGVTPHIVEAVLNHVSGHKAGIAGVYNRASYEREKRAALAMWADHMLAAVEGRAGNVLAIRA